jgi:curved DNA-binding protein CbpA
MKTAPFRVDPGRPEFMATLGLLPPYTLHDVKAAYRIKAFENHPDRGGVPADFMKVHEAYKRATEYVQISGDRRGWIADQVETHLRQQEVAAEVQRLGGQTEFEETDWLKHYVGDFAQLADRLRVIRLQDTAADDAFLHLLAEQPPRTPYLMELSLAGTRITDKGLQALKGLELLRRLDLSGTKVTNRGVQAAIRSLPSLEWVGVAGLPVGWLPRWRLRALLRGREAERKRMQLLSPSS